MDNQALRQSTFSTSTVSAEFYRCNMEGLSRICESIVVGPDNKINLRKIAEVLASVLNVDGADIYIKTATENYFVDCATYGEHFGQMTRGQTLVSGSTGRLYEMIETGQPLFNDFQKPDKRDAVSKLAIKLGYQSAVSTPILAGDKLIGMFAIVNMHYWQPNSLELDFLVLIGRILGAAIQNVAATRVDSKVPDSLTSSDKRMLLLISQGLSNEEIGSEMFLSLPSVKRQLRNLLDKLGIETRIEAAVFAAHAGLV